MSRRARMPRASARPAEPAAAERASDEACQTRFAAAARSGERAAGAKARFINAAEASLKINNPSPHQTQETLCERLSRERRLKEPTRIAAAAQAT